MKKIVTNVIATYVRNQVVHSKLNQKYAEQQEMNTNEQVRPEDQTEVEIVLNYMRDHFSLRDQEIMHLYISKEDHKTMRGLSKCYRRKIRSRYLYEQRN